MEIRTVCQRTGRGGRPAGRMSFLEVEDAWKVKDRWIRVGIH